MKAWYINKRKRIVNFDVSIHLMKYYTKWIYNNPGISPLHLIMAETFIIQRMLFPSNGFHELSASKLISVHSAPHRRSSDSILWLGNDIRGEFVKTSTGPLLFFNLGSLLREFWREGTSSGYNYTISAFRVKFSSFLSNFLGILKRLNLAVNDRSKSC